MKTKTVLVVILLVFIVLLVVSLAVFSFRAVFQPAYFSFANACLGFDEEQLEARGLFIAGLTNVSFDETNETTITVEITEFDERTIRHELCHIKQFQSNRLFGCNQPFRKYLNEVSCYTKQFFPLYNDEIEALRNQTQ